MNGVATGRVTGNNQIGTFKLARNARDATPSPQAGAADTAALFRKGFEEVSGWVTKSAALVPADKYTYRPVQTVRTFGELVGHIADAYDFYCGRAAGQERAMVGCGREGEDRQSHARAETEAVDGCVHGCLRKGGDTGQLLANLGAHEPALRQRDHVSANDGAGAAVGS